MPSQPFRHTGELIRGPSLGLPRHLLSPSDVGKVGVVVECGWVPDSATEQACSGGCDDYHCWEVGRRLQ